MLLQLNAGSTLEAAGVIVHSMQLHHSSNVSLDISSCNLSELQHTQNLFYTQNYCAECVLAMHDGSRLC
jgi:hypothetical protein